MSTDSTAAAFAAIVQADAPAAAVDLLSPDSDVRLEAGLEALSPNTRRVYGAALETKIRTVVRGTADRRRLLR